jgi:sugar-phosphatase
MFSDKAFSAFLFDMDGTILTSIAAAERVWANWALRHGIDPAVFLPTIHGVRAIDTIARQNLAGIDIQAEADAITQAELLDVAGIEPIDDALRFLKNLPEHRWCGGCKQGEASTGLFFAGSRKTGRCYL